MALLAGVMLIVPVVNAGVLAISYGLLLGSSMAMSRTFEAAAFARLYGFCNLAAIRGVMRLVTVAASALGPLSVAAGRDGLGDYGSVLTFLLVIPSGLVVAALLTPVPPAPTLIEELPSSCRRNVCRRGPVAAAARAGSGGSSTVEDMPITASSLLA